METTATITGTLTGDINGDLSVDLSGIVSGSIEGPYTVEIKLIPISGEPLFGEKTIN
jgi:hypothetical protein